MKNGVCKWFNNQKGYGFIKGEDGVDMFVHYSQLQMDGFKTLNEDDVVTFKVGIGENGREQAENVQPVITRQMIENSLKEENLYVQTMKDTYGNRAYMVVDQNNVIQAGQQGMAFLELAAYAGYDVEGR